MSTNRRFFQGLARAFGGAFLFNLPLWMTMEMWWLGFYMDRWRLILLILLTIPLLVGLSYFAGFEDTFSFKEDLVDAFVALAVGVVTSVIMLAVMGIITNDMSMEELVGKVALETVPASIGALLAQSMLGQQSEPRKRKRIHYFGGLFLMAVGALFVAWNVAPTEEILVIAYSMTSVHGIVVMLLSLLIIHAFMFSMEFRGEPDIPEDTPFITLLLRETVVGYTIALLLSAYVLWSFGRLDGVAAAPALLAIVVLGLPAALGAAAARLIV